MQALHASRAEPFRLCDSSTWCTGLGCCISVAFAAHREWDLTLKTIPTTFLPLVVAVIIHFLCHRLYRRPKRTTTDSSHRPQSLQAHHFHASCRTLPLCVTVMVVRLINLQQRRPFQYSSLSTRSWILVSKDTVCTTSTTTNFGKLHVGGIQLSARIELTSL